MICGHIRLTQYAFPRNRSRIWVSVCSTIFFSNEPPPKLDASHFKYFVRRSIGFFQTPAKPAQPKPEDCVRKAFGTFRQGRLSPPLKHAGETMPLTSERILISSKASHVTAGRFCMQPPSVVRSMRYVVPSASPMTISLCRTSADNSSQARINSRTSAQFGTPWHCVTSDSASPFSKHAVSPAFSAVIRALVGLFSSSSLLPPTEIGIPASRLQ